MAAEDNKPTLLILGIHKSSEGYPNVLYRLNELRTTAGFHVREINTPFWKEGAYRLALLRLPLTLCRSLIAYATLLLKYVRLPTPEFAYVPYPSIFVLAMLSTLPRGLKPGRVVADAFISIYDTMVNDRNLLKPNNPLARLLHQIEKVAYGYADLVIVDTSENAAYLLMEFGLSRDKVKAIPLSTNEVEYHPSIYKLRTGTLRVLFFGTLVPLHGVLTIVEAAAHLKYRTDIEFRLIGDGQEAPKVERLIARHNPNLVWLRDWLTPGQLAEEIEQSDICLGIFGNTAKAQRVCPLKIYAYSRVGRAIITGETKWLQHILNEFGRSPFASVPIADPMALANKILELAETPALRSSMAADCQSFYETTLSNRVANDQLTECLNSLKA